MQDWIKDIIEQVCIGEVLRQSKLESNNRLSLIVIDNAVEFALKFYASYNALVNQKELATNEGFYKALDAVTPSLISTDDAKELKQFHNHRNSLYHGAKLVTVKDDLIERYVKLAKKIFLSLFKFSMTDQQWKVQINKVRKALVEDEGVLEPISFESREIDGYKLVQMKASAGIMNTEGIQLVIHGYNMTYARSPNIDEFEKSLKISGLAIPSEVLDVNLSQLRSAGKIERRQLSLKSEAVDKLKKKFIF
jgi:hypothetical protein